MSPRLLAVGLLVVGCLLGAAGGAYFATRPGSEAAGVPPAAEVAAPAVQPQTPVQDTEAIVAPAGIQKPEAEPVRPAIRDGAAPRTRVGPEPGRPVQAGTDAVSARLPAPEPAPPASPPPSAAPATAERPSAVETLPAVPTVALPEVKQNPPVVAEPQIRQFEELVVPASSVIGVQVETAVSSERARVEDRVEARVTRDVLADGTVAISAGSRVIGSVTLVERGGKMRERARLGVRFHTLVLADGREVALPSEAISREGDSPASESARKIGGAAVGGAILGALLGGGKGAAIGGAAGAAGGSAAVMAGGRNAATLPAGTIVTLRLSAPVTIEVEKR